MAFELAGIPYHFDNVYTSAIGHVTQEAGTDRTFVCQTGGFMHILHLDHSGKPLWYNTSLFRDKNKGKAFKQWVAPEVWAADSSGPWLFPKGSEADCMLITDPKDVHALSDGGFDVLHQQIVAEAQQTDRQFDSLIS